MLDKADVEGLMLRSCPGVGAEGMDSPVPLCHLTEAVTEITQKHLEGNSWKQEIGHSF